MLISRRQFVHRGATAALIGTMSARRWALGWPTHHTWTMPGGTFDRARLEPQALLADPLDVRTIALRAIDAARSAGATYADVRLTRTVTHELNFGGDTVVGGTVSDDEELGVGVRSLVNGYWGFAASPYWDPDEVIQLAQTAVAMAKTNALGTPRRVELGAPSPARGSWTSPVRLDPFAVTIEEKIDMMNSWRQAINDTRAVHVLANPYSSDMSFVRQERFVASTEGMYTAQTLYTSGGNFLMSVQPLDWRARESGQGVVMSAEGIEAHNAGWELFLDAKIPEQIPALIEKGAVRLALPHRPTPIGRFDVVFDAATTASLLARTIGVATQLDRAFGYEANASGTSYLGPNPLAGLGTYQVGAPLLSVTGNRSIPGGLATVQWDDEGIMPDDFTLVNNGVLMDYQTTREQAAWLAPWYQRQNIPVRSHGCAAAESALAMTMQFPPNLAMAPGKTAASFAELIADTPKGIAIQEGSVQTDFQAKNGAGTGFVREITNGKLGAILANTSFLFTATDLWKNLIAVGGRDSVTSNSIGFYKGLPEQQGGMTVTAVPTKIKDLSIIDSTRKG